MRTIFIIQMHTGTLPAKVIRRVTHYPYSHVGLSLSRDCSTVYSFGRKRLHNFLMGGFVKQTSGDLFFQKFPHTSCRVLEVWVTNRQYHDLELLLHDFDSRDELLRYDFCGLLLRQVLRRPVTFRNRYVCSHFVAELLQRAGIHSFGRESCMVRPGDFSSICGANEVYCGRYPLC